MVRSTAAALLVLSLAAASAPAQAQYYSSAPGASGSRNGVAVEQLPPPGPNIDVNGDYIPTARGNVPPVVQRGSEGRLPTPGFMTPVTQPQPAEADADPEIVRPPQPVGTPQQQQQATTPSPQATPPAPADTAALPPEDQPETGQPKELPASLRRQLVDYQTKEPAGTIIVDTAHTYLYLVLGSGKALRYGIGVGREGFTWNGTERVSRMKEWPDWFPPPEMIDRQPYLPRMMAGGPGNPLGARALYLGNTLYRIHGTNQPSTIGQYVSSGCIRLLNEDIEDLYSRVQVGTRVVVLPGNAPLTASNGASGASATNASVMVEPAPVETDATGNNVPVTRRH
jgi:lipoprotein-anchoring transpeptidase ErfK/SrfK